MLTSQETSCASPVSDASKAPLAILSGTSENGTLLYTRQRAAVPEYTLARSSANEGLMSRLEKNGNQMMLAQLNEIIDQRLLSALLQPIIHLQSGEIIGYEGLIRGPSDSPLHSPLNLFKV